MGEPRNQRFHTLLGFHPIQELINSETITGTLYLKSKPEKRLLQLKKDAQAAGITVREVDSAELDKISGKRDHRGALLQYQYQKGERTVSLSHLLSTSREMNSLIIMLDGVTDPHNFGAIIRSADQFYADGLIFQGRRSAPLSQVTVSASAGAVTHVPLCSVPNLVRSAKELKQQGYWIYGAAMNGRSMIEEDLKGKVVLILGSEGKGMSRLLAEECDLHIAIPAHGHIESFNVSVAAGIMMYEIRRQQNFE